ncbi:hypothetical protein BDV93DRAFT_529723 [Ceratobasidium sp. AG-I]|nr:hypothetical protein BDV93DRAFT_529723 [Ceratobasidium sp. AG-I]
MTTFLAYGISNLGMGFALLVRPNVLYQSSLAYLINERYGFRVTDVNTAPGFNNSLACMTIAVGAGATRAGLSGSRSAQASIALMSVVWTAATIASCIITPEVVSATHVIAAIVDTGFSIALVWSGGFSIPELVGLGRRPGTGSNKPRSTRRR